LADLKDFATVLSGAIAAISTLLAVAITNRFNLKLAKLNADAQNNQKEGERRLEKIEQTYLLFETWETTFMGMCFLFVACYANKLDYQSAQKMIATSNPLLPGEFQKLKMLLFVHFPTLSGDFERVIEARDKIGPFLSDPSQSKLTLKDFEVAQKNFDKAAIDFKSKLSALAHDL
jgi:hypothetical protein